MGQDKSGLNFAGKTGVEHISRALQSVATRIRLVGRPSQSVESSLDQISDLHENWGALGGIHAALEACPSRWAAIVACVLPLVTGELFLRLWSQANDPVDAVVPIQQDERVQPLCAFYRQDILAHVEFLISQGEHTPRALLERVNTRRIKYAELADVPGAENFFLNVNTPGDFHRATEYLRAKRNPE